MGCYDVQFSIRRLPMGICPTRRCGGSGKYQAAVSHHAESSRYQQWWLPRCPHCIEACQWTGRKVSFVAQTTCQILLFKLIKLSVKLYFLKQYLPAQSCRLSLQFGLQLYVDVVMGNVCFDAVQSLQWVSGEFTRKRHSFIFSTHQEQGAGGVHLRKCSLQWHNLQLQSHVLTTFRSSSRRTHECSSGSHIWSLWRCRSTVLDLSIWWSE